QMYMLLNFFQILFLMLLHLLDLLLFYLFLFLYYLNLLPLLLQKINLYTLLKISLLNKIFFSYKKSSFFVIIFIMFFFFIFIFPDFVFLKKKSKFCFTKFALFI